MFSMKKDKNVNVKKIKIKSGKRKIPALVLSPKNGAKNATGILWIHVGGYFLGMKEMVHMSRAVDLVKKYGAVVISPYPAALDDCYATLLYLKEHADELGVRSDQNYGRRRERRRRTLCGGVYDGKGQRRGKRCVSDAALSYAR